MTWIIPGQEYDVEIDGVTVTLKSLTVKEKMTIARSLLEGKDKPENIDIENLLNTIAGQVVKIVGENIPEKPVKEILDYQSNEILLAIFTAIIGGGILKETEAKN